jgi:hypothetical protein
MDLTAILEENEEMRRALEPFAQMAATIPENIRNVVVTGDIIYEKWCAESSVTVEDVRNAARVLGMVEHGPFAERSEVKNEHGNGMTQHQKVHDLVDQFLAKGRLSDGGFALFTHDDERLLNQLLCALDEAKFQRDPDGDTPLNWVIINRTKYQPHHYVRVPYTHENLDGAFRESLLNLEMATKAVRECMWLMRRKRGE